MQELIDGELISVKDPPRVSQMCVNGVAVRAVLLRWFGVMPIKQVQQKFVSGDLKGRNEIAPAGPHFPGRRLLRLLGIGRADGTSLRRCRRGGPDDRDRILREARIRRHKAEDERGDEDSRPFLLQRVDPLSG